MTERPYPWEDADMDAVHGRAADGRHYARCCCDWFTSSMKASQVGDALGDHVKRCSDALLAGIEQQRVLERIWEAESLEEMNAIWHEDDEDDGPPDQPG